MNVYLCYMEIIVYGAAKVENALQFGRPSGSEFKRY